MSKNIGDLKVIIGAKIDDFKNGIAQAKKEAEGFRDKVSKTFADVGDQISKINPQLGGLVSGFGGLSAAGGGLVAIAGGMTAIGISVANSAKELSNFASISGSTTAEFQMFAAGAKSVGVEQEDLADKFKDFRERVGEFTQTGSGPMQDFFEQVAPKIGVTADQFAKLSGPQALQLYVSSLEKAGLSQEEMIWYMENMAGDLSKLLPLMQDGGKSLKEYGQYASDVGAIMSDELVSASKEVTGEISKTQAGFTGMVYTIAGEAMPTVSKMIALFNDATAQLQPYIKTISTGLGYAFRGIVVAGYSVIRTVMGVTGSIGALGAAAFALMTGDVKGAVELAKQAGKQITGIYDDIRDKGGDILLDTKNVQTDNPTFNTKTNNKGSGGLGVGAKAQADKGKTPKKENYIDPLTDSAKAYQKALEDMNKAQSDIAISQMEAAQGGEKLTGTQKRLIELYQSPEFLNAPDEWKKQITRVAELTISMEKQAEDQLKLNALLEATPTAQLEKQRELMAYLAKAFEDGRINAEQFSEAANTALGNIPNATKDAESSILNLSTAMSDAAGGMADAMIGFASGAKQSFGDFARSFLANLAKMIIQQMIFNALQKGANAMAGGGGWLGAIGTALGGKASANGNVFTPGVGGPSLVPFANGGVFNQPITFPMSGGKVGLMGEAGPEAIMPLTRIGGKLGVKAVGGGGGTIVQTVNVTVQSSGNESADQLGSKVAEATIRALAKQEIISASRRGGILNPV